MNVLEDPAGLAELQALGVRSVPVLSRGRKFVFGQSLPQIVAFLGLAEKTGPELAPEELQDRLDRFMGAALGLLPLMPADRLATHVPGRPRSYRSLGFHLFRVVDAFLDAEQGATLVQAMFRDEPAPDADIPSLVAYGATIRARFDNWRMAGDRSADRSLSTYYGPQTLHELLERTTWHCGQHVRQWMMLLQREGIVLEPPCAMAISRNCPCPRTSGTADRRRHASGNLPGQLIAKPSEGNLPAQSCVSSATRRLSAPVQLWR